MMDDTTPEARRVQTDVYRRMTPAQKWRILEGTQRTARVLFESGLRHRNPNVTDQDVQEAWIEATLPGPLFEIIRDLRRASAG